MRARLLVLGWHNVEGSWFFPAPPGSGTRVLRHQLKVIARTCNVVPLSGALDELQAGRRLPSRAVALTFDDGYRDALLAADLLGRLGLPATFFLVPEALSGRPVAWWEDLGQAVWSSQRDQLELDGTVFDLASPGARRSSLVDLATRLRRTTPGRRGELLVAARERLSPLRADDISPLFLSWEEASHLVRQGHNVGSHSRTHAVLSQLGPADLRRELADARALLQEGLGVDADLLAYPYGNVEDVDDRVEASAAEAGYRYALTTVPGTIDGGSRWLRLDRQLLGCARTRDLAQVRHSFGGVRGILGLGPSRRRDPEAGTTHPGELGIDSGPVGR